MTLRVIVALLFLTVGSFMASPAAGTPAGMDAYTLGPGDTIEILVVGDKDLSRSVTIKPDGSIDLPLVGEVKAAQRTTSQLAAELVKRYSTYLVSPSITVSVRDFRVDRIYIWGQVNKPGVYPIVPGTGILELLASAGGPTDRADLTKATIVRGETNGKTDPIEVNLLTAFAKNENLPVKLQPGDVLYVPATDRRIVILGQVNRPGAYDLLEGQHVSDLIAAAGGVTPQAGLQHAFLMRGAEQTPIDVQKILAGDTEANLPLKWGDTVVVPESKDRIAVLGSVNRPGKYDLQEGMKLSDAIALAGGQSDGGNLGQVAIIRIEGGKTKMIAANLTRALRGQDANQNIALQPGDVVYVPERGLTLAKASQFFNIFYIVRLIFGIL